MARKCFVTYEVFELADILDDRRLHSIQVKFLDGGTAWLPRSKVTFGPGRVFVPTWLANRIGKERSVKNAGTNRSRAFTNQTKPV
jgi:hypothetical protein